MQNYKILITHKKNAMKKEMKWIFCENNFRNMYHLLLKIFSLTNKLIKLDALFSKFEMFHSYVSS